MEAVQDVIWSGRPDLRRPVMVCAFRGWNDAGEAASAAVSFIRESVDSQDVASINPEEFFDFTAVRPNIRLTEGNTREIDWPDGTISAAYVPGAESDLVVLEATEPSLRWRRYTENVMSVARELGVRKVITLGALLADVPHSRPVAVTGLSSDSGVVEKLGFQRTSYEGPTGIVGVLHHACIQAGVESASLWASVPHYVAAAPNPKVALALVRGFEGVAGVVVDAGELESAADDYERQVSAAVASDPEVKAFVERLETAMDEEQ
ncbi:MAG TPA: PAC2 family protein, partial [Thermoleophilaceae bacterium]|nr:PAC2 family protein [Thermoleophilaceae bacterium]